jgi:hypothetical protein
MVSEVAAEAPVPAAAVAASAAAASPIVYPEQEQGWAEQQEEAADGEAGNGGGEEDFSPLNLMSVENCLCEGNKYFRVRFQDGSGRFKQKYVPRNGADDSYRENFAVMSKTLRESWHPQSAVAEDALGSGHGYSGATFAAGGGAAAGLKQEQPEQQTLQPQQPPCQGGDDDGAASAAAAYGFTKVDPSLAEAPAAAQATDMDVSAPVPADLGAPSADDEVGASAVASAAAGDGGAAAAAAAIPMQWEKEEPAEAEVAPLEVKLEVVADEERVGALTGLEDAAAAAVGAQPGAVTAGATPMYS